MSWWRQQRIALISLAVAGAAAIGVHVWLDVLPAIPDEPAVVSSPEGPTSIAGQELELSSARWDEYAAPAGSRSLSIRLDARAGADSDSCGTFVLREAHGARVWQNARSALDVPYDDDESGCATEPGRYRILAVFLLPDDAAGPFLLDVPAYGRVARFSLTP